ncbi:hypothetical protein [Sporosarcina sp. NPDC096371]|uniref:hypothetical protein n=1 Tax=Sporosarcina sp. NPDC096371 TaxID=3364530 RepID=UPI003825E4B8
MAYGIISLLPILFIIAIVFFFLRLRKTAVKRATIHFSRKLHFALITGYVVFLLAVLVISEFVEQQHQPPSFTSELTESDYFELDNSISSGEISEFIPSSLLIEKRTHPAGEKLKIQNSYDSAYIYIERKNDADEIIEEFIYKPMLFFDQQDASDMVNVTKPIWKDATITVPRQPLTEIRKATFHDATLLNQMTSKGFRNPSIGSSTSRPLIIHLLVPKDVVIETLTGGYIEFVEK